MKRLFFTLTLALSLISMSSFAGDDTIVSETVIKSFNTNFKSATEVSWTISDNFYKASFMLNGQHVAAFYNCDGQMIGMTRNISSTQLPIALQASLKRSYDGYWISDLFEMANEEGTFYYITLENADTKLVLKSTSDADWTSYQKQRKS
ncbi:MAG: hypothetical protein EOO04_36735 [Chitinophagaceae bacterium]|nr:MAG: hypothetical protein EOO04_36735 [Chitinophagaceae bacterium]